VRDASVHQHRIARPRIVSTSITRNYFNISCFRQELLRALGERFIDLHHGDLPAWTDNLGHDGGVVAGTSTEMKDSVSFA
jgi:hypothetical protein